MLVCFGVFLVCFGVLVFLCVLTCMLVVLCCAALCCAVILCCAAVLCNVALALLWCCGVLFGWFVDHWRFGVFWCVAFVCVFVRLCLFIVFGSFVSLYLL